MSTMKKWCNHCVKMVIAERPFDGSLCCSECGKVFELYNFSNDPTFEKDGAGQSSMSGNFVRTVQSDYSASRERTLDRAYDDMKYMCLNLGMDQPDGIVKAALAFYRMALEKNFTRGRRSEHVQAACLYIACREDKLPYLLIDFSNMLQINVYVLGAVFLQLCKALWLEEHHIVQKPIDPSLFIHKYTTSLSGGRNNDIARTALRIIASMRRDWMQTGRKPSGLWGAAVYVSALAHGVKCTKNDVLRLVHICETTLTKRLVEFENTKSGSLTVEELNDKARAEEKIPAKHPNIISDPCNSRDLLCEHKGTGALHYAIGLCQSCYNEFVDFSGGLEGGSDPPAFQRAERERQTLAAAEEANESTSIEKELDGLSANKNEKLQYETGKAESSTFEEQCPDDGSDNLSDIDDAEVVGYLHNEKEKQYKKIIWEKMNREYVEEQAAKEAAAAAAKEAFAANFKNGSEDMLAAQELAAATAAALAKSKKEKQQKRAAEAKNMKPPQTAAEATRQILMKKRLTSKVNYDVLEKLFDEPAAPENVKSKQIESHDDNKETTRKKHKKEEKKHQEKDEELPMEEDKEEEEERVMEVDEMGVFDDYNCEDTEEAYGYDEEEGW